MKRRAYSSRLPVRDASTLLPIAVRAYAIPHPTKTTDSSKTRRIRNRRQRGDHLLRGGLVLVFDCETTIDPSQRLLFGSWRVYDQGRCIDEGLFHADDLSSQDHSILETYARTRVASIERPGASGYASSRGRSSLIASSGLSRIGAVGSSLGSICLSI